MHFCIKKVSPVPANPRCDRACCPWGYLASYLAFFPKRCHFGAKTAIFLLSVVLTWFIPCLCRFCLQTSLKICERTSQYWPEMPSCIQCGKLLAINLTAMSRGFESHRLRQKQHPAGRCFLFLQQTMQGLQGGIRTARARRSASRRAATVLRTVARARGNPTACAKYHYSILH